MRYHFTQDSRKAEKFAGDMPGWDIMGVVLEITDAGTEIEWALVQSQKSGRYALAKSGLIALIRQLAARILLKYGDCREIVTDEPGPVDGLNETMVDICRTSAKLKGGE